jgi:K+-sensing histidine kinase KdpD
LVILDVQYDSANKVFREIPGVLYNITHVFYGIFLTLLVTLWYKVVKKQIALERRRLVSIIISTFLLVFSLVVLQLILPIFGIWILEKEIIIVYSLYVISVFYTLKKYYFSQFLYGFGKLLNIGISFVVSVVFTNIIQYLYFSPYARNEIMNYWASWDAYNIALTFSWILSFYISYFTLGRFFIKSTIRELLDAKIATLKDTISGITDLARSFDAIWKEMKKIFSARLCEVIIFSEVWKNEIQRYFEHTKRIGGIFINDKVFFQEKCEWFSIHNISEILPKDTFLAMPLFDTESVVFWILVLWQKPFWDFYTEDEITAIREFIPFLEMHIKYIKTYEQIQDFSKNLDKKVDEKTIEYNSLINKQKEFISTISHEIKSPIAGAILQVDSMMDDLEDKNFSKESLKQELHLLDVQLVKVGDLLSKLFSVQYFDTHSVTLFKEKILIQNLLNMELDIYERLHEHVHVHRKIDPKMGFLEIDKIQFQQVLTNLLTNVSKFAQQKNPEIIVEAYMHEKKFYFAIEDNGNGFEGIDISQIFDRYAVWTSGSVGLWLWLYLCKHIVEMHHGTISAREWSILHGARIEIVLPIV